MAGEVAVLADGEMVDLLVAMQEKALQDKTALKYIDHVKMKVGPWYWRPFNRYTLYIIPGGSPQVAVAEHGDVTAWRMTHEVKIECCVPYKSPEIEDSIVGRGGKNVGITTMAKDVCDFFENNMLGLTGLDPRHPPWCEVQSESYDDVEVGDRFFIRVCTVRYYARTKHFMRTVTT